VGSFNIDLTNYYSYIKERYVKLTKSKLKQLIKEELQADEAPAAAATISPKRRERRFQLVQQMLFEHRKQIRDLEKVVAKLKIHVDILWKYR